jgi:hypothetical protein
LLAEPKSQGRAINESNLHLRRLSLLSARTALYSANEFGKFTRGSLKNDVVYDVSHCLILGFFSKSHLLPETQCRSAAFGRLASKHQLKSSTPQSRWQSSG